MTRAKVVAMPGIRLATLADLSQIITLDQLIFGPYGADEDPDLIRVRLQIFPAGCMVLERADRRNRSIVLGYLTCEKWSRIREPKLDEDPRETHEPDGVILCITTLAVAPEHQNRGYGARLLDEACNFARQQGCEQIILETAHAERFYSRHGFTVLSKRSQRGIHLTVMQLGL